MYRQNSIRNMIRSSARSRSLLKHAGDVFSLKVALGACHLADISGTTIPNNRFYKFIREKGIILNNCPAYVHELNGTAERFNRTIMDMARCLLTEAQVHKRYWP